MQRIVFAAGTVFAAGLLAISSPASAQAGPAPGTGNSAGITSANREQNAAYNRLVGDRNQRPVLKGKAVAAKRSDVLPGSALRDVNGLAVGTVQSVDGEEAIVQTAAGPVRIPLIGFGKDKAGLLLGMTADQLQAAIAAAGTGG